MLASLHKEMFDIQCQLDIVAHKSIETYKKLEECTSAKRDYTTTSYLYGRNDVQAKVLIKYSTLWLTFSMKDLMTMVATLRSREPLWVLLTTHPQLSEVYVLCFLLMVSICP